MVKKALGASSMQTAMFFKERAKPLKTLTTSAGNRTGQYGTINRTELF